MKSAKEYPARATRYVATSCLVAASGGLIFGYDVGISGCNSCCVFSFRTDSDEL